MKLKGKKIVQSIGIIQSRRGYPAVNKFTWKSQWINMKKIYFSIVVYIQWVLGGGEEFALCRN